MHQPAAAMLVIGDEILSGRTQDKNINRLACHLQDRGIALLEVRITGDRLDDIIEAVKALSERYDLVFTSGGIGPTHDDITTAAIATAFGVKVVRDPEANRRLVEHYRGTGIEYNAARQKMADIPEGATLIDNPVSAAPGYRLSNVYALAGVPVIFAAMLDGVEAMLPTGTRKRYLSIQVSLGEATLAEGLSDIEAAHEGIGIGCYPWFKPGCYGTAVVVSGLDGAVVDEAAGAVLHLVESLGGEGHLEPRVAGGNSD